MKDISIYDERTVDSKIQIWESIGWKNVLKSHYLYKTKARG